MVLVNPSREEHQTLSSTVLLHIHWNEITEIKFELLYLAFLATQLTSLKYIMAYVCCSPPTKPHTISIDRIIFKLSTIRRNARCMDATSNEKPIKNGFSEFLLI